MNTLKSFVSKFSLFLQKVRTFILDLGTALVLIFLTIAIVGALFSSGPDEKDPSGRVLLIAPSGTVVDQETFNSDFLFNVGASASAEQIQTEI